MLFNTVLQNSLKDDIQRWQKKKEMGIYLSDHDHDCLTNLRFADDVLLFASSKKKQLNNRLCEFKKRRKFLATKDIKIEILTRGESVRYLGQMITILQQEKTEIKNRIRAAWYDVPQVQAELTSRNY